MVLIFDPTDFLRSPMTHSNASPTYTYRLTALYITSLGVVAGLAIAGQVLVRHMLAQQGNDLQVVTLLQQKQILCQEISKSALVLRLTPGNGDRQNRQTEFQASLDAWKKSGERIKQEVAQLASQDSDLAREISALEPVGKAMVDSAKAIATAEPGASNVRRKPGNSPIPALLRSENTLMQKTEQVILTYNQQAQRRVDALKTVELGLLGITLLVLLLEGLVVFRPAVKKIQAAVAALADSLQVTQATADQLTIAQEQSQRLLLNILPESIADRLKQNHNAIADGFAEVTILFADIVGFTELSSRLSPHELVHLLNQIFSSFDHLAEKHQLEKIKTIGDAYMVVGGLPMPRSDHATAIADMALDMQRAIDQFNTATGNSLSMRIGINTGSVVAGVIGIKKFIYDLWGDTVNIASRMESHSLPGSIQLTESTYQYLQGHYHLEPRGAVQIKGKGEMQTYWLKARKH
jgi:adenylate cyclase